MSSHNNTGWLQVQAVYNDGLHLLALHSIGVLLAPVVSHADSVGHCLRRLASQTARAASCSDQAHSALCEGHPRRRSTPRHWQRVIYHPSRCFGPVRRQSTELLLTQLIAPVAWGASYLDPFGDHCLLWQCQCSLHDYQSSSSSAHKAYWHWQSLCSWEGGFGVTLGPVSTSSSLLLWLRAGTRDIYSLTHVYYVTCTPSCILIIYMKSTLPNGCEVFP